MIGGEKVTGFAFCKMHPLSARFDLRVQPLVQPEELSNYDN